MAAADRREQLLDVAVPLFAEHGYHGLSMEQLADAAGVSKPVLYQHFPSKRALFLALVHDAVDRLRGRVTAALEGTNDNRARVEGAIRGYFDFVADDRFRLLEVAETGDAEVRQAVEDARSDLASHVAKLIAEDAGLSPRAAELLATGVRGFALDGARWWAALPADARVESDDAVKLLSQLLWRGLSSFERP